MDSRLLPRSPPAPPFLPPAARGPAIAGGGGRRPRPRRSLAVVAGASRCESSSLNTPLVPESAAGRYLTRVLQNQRQLFHVAVAEELKQLADDRDAAVSRVLLSAGSDEACLHRYWRASVDGLFGFCLYLDRQSLDLGVCWIIFGGENSIGLHNMICSVWHSRLRYSSQVIILL